MTALEIFARVIYEAEPELETRNNSDLVRDATGFTTYSHTISWNELPDAYPYARERALRQAQAVLDFVKKGITS